MADGVLRELWRVVPLETPRLERVCPRCNMRREFASSDRFRVNAQKRRVDVWLIYRCSACDATWNQRVVRRRAPESIEMLDAFTNNDRDAAWRVAFDLAPNREVPVRVERDDPDEAGARHVRFALALPCRVRLDRLLAGALEVSRSKLRRMVEDGVVRPARPLRAPVRDGDEVWLHHDETEALDPGYRKSCTSGGGSPGPG